VLAGFYSFLKKKFTFRRNLFCLLQSNDCNVNSSSNQTLYYQPLRIVAMKEKLEVLLNKNRRKTKLKIKKVLRFISEKIIHR
jgi:hypothetical protein